MYGMKNILKNRQPRLNVIQITFACCTIVAREDSFKDENVNNSLFQSTVMKVEIEIHFFKLTGLKFHLTEEKKVFSLRFVSKSFFFSFPIVFFDWKFNIRKK
jgi:hypothetical protein